MATDFFDRQDHARRLTRRLVILFAISVATIILAIYLVLVAVGAGDVVNNSGHHAVHGPRTRWNPLLLLWVAGGTGLIVGLGSLYKIAELSAGGPAIAEMVGGRALNPQTTDLAERRLLNVVEEMALASGIPVPPVYVLDNETSINAFAAGHRPGDAIVAVSAGCLAYLTREELQGVLGHEFSHILNGDMRLNLRLIGVVYGILVLAVVGYYIMRSAGVSTSRRSDEKDNSGSGIFFLGLALLVLGYIGVFFGKLIKAAISRQREFLADASSVQFTRNPGGIGGALKKIGGLAEGSQIHDGHAEEISHMFFGDAFAGTFMNLFATHPPLADRIRALEPDFDGRFPEVRPVAIAAADVEKRPVAPRRPPLVPGAVAAPYAAMALDSGEVVRRIGQPQEEHLRHAEQIVGRMPQVLVDAAHEPSTARAVIFALLLSDDEATRTRQDQLLADQLDPHLVQQTRQLFVDVQSLDAAARLPLVDMAVPALKNASAPQYQQFRKVVDALVAADGRVDLFEYCLRTLLLSYLDVHFGLAKPPAVRYRTLSAIARPASVVLSTLAYIGQTKAEDVERAFQAGVAGLPVATSLVAKEACTLAALDAALAELAQSSPQVKRDVITAVTRSIAADGRVTLEESELLRVIAAVLGCPIPPMPGNRAAG
jgi:Zn-dependent protease with chaperone function